MRLPKKLDNLCFDFWMYMGDHPGLWDAIGLGLMFVIIIIAWWIWR